MCFPLLVTKSFRLTGKDFSNEMAKRGNYNGFVFRLVPDDFPVVAGDWFLNRYNTPDYTFGNRKQMLEVWGETIATEAAATQIPIPKELYEDEFTSPVDGDWSWFIIDIKCFEIIIPRAIMPNRILKIVKDREPKKTRSHRLKHQARVDLYT